MSSKPRATDTQHAAQNAIDDPEEIARFPDRCSDLMRDLLVALASMPDQPRPLPEIEDAIAGHDGGSPACSAASGICVAPTSPADARIASWTSVTRTRAAGRCGWTTARPTLYAPHHVDSAGVGIDPADV